MAVRETTKNNPARSKPGVAPKKTARPPQVVPIEIDTKVIPRQIQILEKFIASQIEDGIQSRSGNDRVKGIQSKVSDGIGYWNHYATARLNQGEDSGSSLRSGSDQAFGSTDTLTLRRICETLGFCNWLTGVLSIGTSGDDLTEDLIQGISREDLNELKNLCLGLVSTAHPTNVMNPNGLVHVNDIAKELDESQGIRSKERIEGSIKTLVKTPLARANKVTAIDESTRNLAYLDRIWTSAAEMIVDIENQIRKKFKAADFSLSRDFFRMHSWIAREIDGNPTISLDQHIRAINQERLHVLKKYKEEIKALKERMSQEFMTELTVDAHVVALDPQFKELYDQCKTSIGSGYKAVLDEFVLKKLNNSITMLRMFPNRCDNNIFSVEKDLIPTLEAILRNMQATESSQGRSLENLSYTRNVDILLRKAYIFGDLGYTGHFRQLSYKNSALARRLGILENSMSDIDRRDALEEFILRKTKIKTISSKELTGDSTSEDETMNLQQTHEMLYGMKFGGSKRFIISMNRSADDMLTALALAKKFGYFRINRGKPETDIEIVPLTEELDQFQNSWKLTIDALQSPAWRQYLIANHGRFVKMRGHSDGTKQQGVWPAQWEIFRSKQLDSIVVAIFNAKLQEQLDGDGRELRKWQTEKSQFSKEEQTVIDEALKAFDGIPKPELKLWGSTGNKVRLAAFDGFGEPTERGHGLEFEKTISHLQPDCASGDFDRTIQGGGASHFGYEGRARENLGKLFKGQIKRASNRRRSQAKSLVEQYSIDRNFARKMQEISDSTRRSLRTNVFGMEKDENKPNPQKEKQLHSYIEHVLLSPLSVMSLLNIASRPISRTDSKLAEMMSSRNCHNLLELAQVLKPEEVIKFLDDVRAVPYVAMFSLFGGNHVSYYGLDPRKAIHLSNLYSEAINNPTPSQEARLVQHLVDTVELSLVKADPEVYAICHEKVRKVYDPNYTSSNDSFIKELNRGHQEAVNFICKVKGYNPNIQGNHHVNELMQDDPAKQALMFSRRNSAAAVKIGLAHAMARLFTACQEKNITAINEANIKANGLHEELLTLQTAFVAASTGFGNTCLDT